MWSLILRPGQTYQVEITTPIQLTNVSFGDEVVGTERSVVKVRLGVDDHEDIAGPNEASTSVASVEEIIVAALTPGQMEVATTSVLLSNEVDYVVFSVTGPNSVHLVGHYTDLNSTSAGLHGVLMASDSDDEDTDGEVDDEELSNELKELQMDSEAHMPVAQYALDDAEFQAELAGYEYKDKTYPAGLAAFVDLPLEEEDDDSEFTIDAMQSDTAMQEDDEEEAETDPDSDGGSDEGEDEIRREVEEVRMEVAALKAEKEAKRLARKNAPVAMQMEE